MLRKFDRVKCFFTKRAMAPLICMLVATTLFLSANSQEENIYAVPGRITDKLSGGCNNLIKMGAKVVTTAQDILEDFIDYMPSESGQRVFTNIFNDDEKAIYELISVSPKHLDELIETTGLEMGKLMEHLLSLELKNLISQPVKNYYMKKG